MFPPEQVSLLSDIVDFVKANFGAHLSSEALQLVKGAVLHDGEMASPRLQRAAVVASAGDIERLKYYVKLIAVDFRDVIMAGEYKAHSGRLIRVRDLTKEIPLSDIPHE